MLGVPAQHTCVSQPQPLSPTQLHPHTCSHCPQAEMYTLHWVATLTDADGTWQVRCAPSRLHRGAPRAPRRPEPLVPKRTRSALNPNSKF